MLNTLRQIRWLVCAICICLFTSTIALCTFVLLSRTEIQSIAASLATGQAALTEQNAKAATTRDALNTTLRSLQREILRVDAEMDAREQRLDAKLDARKH